MSDKFSVEIPKTVNKFLENERKKCTFDVEEFSRWWAGGEAKLVEKRYFEKIFLEDPAINDEYPTYFMSHKELYENCVKKASFLIKRLRELQEDGKAGIEVFMALLSGSIGSGVIPAGNPLGLHYIMFIPTLLGQATTEQQGEWLGRAFNCEIIGTYAQTELGHGTFIRGLETTATYDSKTEEFVLNSPTLTSFKWWPGGLAHTANHAVVVAQLYTQGKCYGIHPFIVQLRDENTHMPLKGIIIGEIGNKLGMNGVNNGFLGFKNVRIPRKNMLMKNSKVQKDGTYSKAPSSVLTYGTMVFVRVVIVRDMANYISKAATIATRYSAVRHQSQINPDKPEVQIIDHITQQNKIFPAIAKSIIFKLAADDIWETYNAVTAELEKGNLERLPELHALACCLKAVCTADAAQTVETCRLACGGHGYCSSSNLPVTYGLVTAASTYEGENTVLLLQTARYLLKSWASALKGENLPPTVSYLSHAVKYNNIGSWDSSIIGIIDSLKTVAAEKVRRAYVNIEERKKSGMSHENAFNHTSIELANAAEAHSRAILVESGYMMVGKHLKKVSPALGSVLQKIVDLYAVEASLKAMGDLLRFTNITENDINKLQARLERLLMELRDNAVGIVDGFGLHDKILNSTLGAYDGNVYERLFVDALKSPLNQEPVNETFHKYLKPMLTSKL